MSEQRSIVDKMGIAFLTEPTAPPDKASTAPISGSQQAVIDRSSRAFANWTVLSALADLGAHDHPVTMAEVADRTRTRADILLPIEDSLAAQGWIEVVDKTTFGNDTVKLTDDGAALAQSGTAPAIVTLGDAS
jgi:hypothetical protein